MIWRIEITTQTNFNDVLGRNVLADIQQLGIHTVQAVHAARVFLIEAEFDQAAANRIAQELLVDPVSESAFIGRQAPPAADLPIHIAEVHLKPGVTDPVADSAMMAIRDMGLIAQSVRTARKFILVGSLAETELKLIAQKVLANDCIETVIFGHDAELPTPHLAPYQLKISHWPIRTLDDEQLVQLSKDRDLFLNVKEMQTIQAYYQKLDRDPTDIELEMIAQTWSEHCVHKTFRGILELTVDNGTSQETVTIDNLLKTTIARATHELKKPWCISVFEDNAGVVEFDDDYAVCFKVETHNHPSAIEPYGGAATGIGGCIRDPMGTGLGAKPIANTDVFCFAPPDMPLDKIPTGVLHPRRIMKGVVGGVRDYGNRMGIPTVNGAIHFDERYLGNPLVFCGNIGIMPRDKCFGKARTGDAIMVVGGRTGRDGIHGATFSSGEMTHEHESLFSHAVQIGNAITEKKTLDTLIQARDAGLYVAITDCGAGGLSSAVGEMGEKLGAVVDLDKIPLKYQGLSYTEIWISEAQERMVIAVPQENLAAIQAIFDAENVEATVIGQFADDQKLILRYQNQIVGQLDMAFLHDGLPKYTRKAHWTAKPLTEPTLAPAADCTGILYKMLSDFNVASKEWVIRQYDHEVQGGSAVKPLVGAADDGPGDAAVVRPRRDSDRAIAISNGICPQYSDIDPYWMAAAAIDEAVRNIIAVGGRFDRIAILDNFCWGNCDKPDRLGNLIRAAQGCYDTAIAYQTPFISGKDSLNNEFKTDTGETINIPGTLLVSAMTLVDDVNRCVTMDFKQPGNLLFIVGETRNELGGSLYYKLHDSLGANVPKVDLKTGPKTAQAVAGLIEQNLIEACHDCSEGGLAVALAEMAFAGNCGAEINLETLPCASDIKRDDQRLFAETPSRYILEIKPEHFNAVSQMLKNIRFAQIGKVTDAGKLTVTSADKSVLIDAELAKLKEAWQAPLRW